MSSAKSIRIKKAAAIRKEEIFEAAARVFKERSYRGATIQEIVEELGVTKGALYYHFKGKEDLLFEVYNRAGTQFFNTMSPIAQGPLPVSEKLRALIIAQVKLMTTEQELFSIFYHEKVELPPDQIAAIKAKEHAYLELVVKIVAEAVREGIVSEIDPNIGALAIMGMCNWATNWYRSNGKLHPEEIGEMFYRLITNNTKC